jgi:exopolyphosphatase/guanosine-5'-triphosphate,3'-diphosphate pyrophosphatase
MDLHSSQTSVKIAAIDIGTNTILLLIAEVQNGAITRILHDQQVIARLGKGVDAERTIHQETFVRAEGFLRQYKETCDSFGVDRICAVGTSALRDAKNREAFINYISERTGIRIELFSGDDEALWTYRGGISEFIGTAETYSVVDIGGGSTEIIIGNANEIIEKTSIDLGSVRLTERILKDSPPEIPALIEAHQFIADHMPSLTKQSASTFCVGVAGTLTTLAALHQKLPHYEPERVSGYRLQYNDVCAMFGLLKDKSISQIQAFPQISAGRADIILAGIMILMGYMESAKMEVITVSDRGLRYGILLREAVRIA